MRLSDFDFDLPDDLVAVRPVRPRSAARLLVAEADTLRDLHVRDLVEVLRPGDRMVLNDTRVLPVRLSGYRNRAGTLPNEGRARIEVTLLQPLDGDTWRAMLKPLRKVRIGEVLIFGGGLSARLLTRDPDGMAVLALSETGARLEACLSDIGAMPLPPYIAARRTADARDKDDYQTVFARNTGAVAAPTASLHFDTPLLRTLEASGVLFTHVTLHVGAGTFLPVKSDNPTEHKMHSEWGEITEQAAEEIESTRRSGGRIIPVGTTALRLLESSARADGHVRPWSGDTDIFIYPGFRFRATDALMTNFHLPKSTLMMLVSALMGVERTRAVYEHAIQHRYRFFSYGDSSLLVPPGTSG